MLIYISEVVHKCQVKICLFPNIIKIVLNINAFSCINGVHEALKGGSTNMISTGILIEKNTINEIIHAYYNNNMHIAHIRNLLSKYISAFWDRVVLDF